MTNVEDDDKHCEHPQHYIFVMSIPFESMDHKWTFFVDRFLFL
jgi:hypothetical protein